MEIVLTFDFHSIIQDLKKNFWVVISAALIAIMGVYIASHSVHTPMYTSTATLVVRAKAGTDGAYTNLSVSSEMAQIYTEIFKQPSVKKLAAAHLGEEEFNGNITASVQGSTNLLNLSVTAEDPEIAYRHLCAVLEIYPNISSAVFSNAVIDVIQDPQMPTSPSNTISNSRQTLIVVLAIGVQCGLIIFLSCLRYTIKNEKVFVDNIDAKLLGTIVHEKPHLSLKERLLRKKRALLINDGYSSLKLTEDFLKIVTKLERIRKTTQDKIFTITSVGENEGKTTSAANIAIALARRGYRVMLLDLDIVKPSIHKAFEYRHLPTPELTTLFSREVEGLQELLDFFRYKKTNLFLVMNKKKHNVDTEWISSKQVRQWIKELSENVDFLILDTTPMAVSADAVSLVEIVDQTILVVRTDRSRIEDVNEAAKSITSRGGVLAGCILNDVHKPVTLFGQVGIEPSRYYRYRYGSYRQYGNYGRSSIPNDVKDKSRVSSNSK